jgi:molybdenum cofactor cytidylyltransferase
MRPVIVVVGAKSDVIKKGMEGMKVKVVENEEWQEGMASSIRCGLQALPDIAPAADGVIIMVCDQPFVSASLLGELITAQKDRGKKIVACKYTNTIGPPVLFHRSFFPALLELKGDEGARKIVVQHMDDVVTVLFPGGDIDIDTAAEYDALKQNQLTDNTPS